MSFFDGIFTAKQSDNIFNPGPFAPGLKPGYRAADDGMVRTGQLFDALLDLRYVPTSFFDEERAAREKAIEKAEAYIATIEKRIEEHRAWLKANPAKAAFALGDKVALVKDCPDRLRGLIGEVSALSLDARGGVTVRVRWPGTRGIGFFEQDRLAKRDGLVESSDAEAAEAKGEEKPVLRFKVGDRVRGTATADPAKYRGMFGTVEELDAGGDDGLPYYVNFPGIGGEWMADDEIEPSRF